MGIPYCLFPVKRLTWKVASAPALPAAGPLVPLELATLFKDTLFVLLSLQRNANGQYTIAEKHEIQFLTKCGVLSFLRLPNV